MNFKLKLCCAENMLLLALCLYFLDFRPCCWDMTICWILTLKSQSNNEEMAISLIFFILGHMAEILAFSCVLTKSLMLQFFFKITQKLGLGVNNMNHQGGEKKKILFQNIHSYPFWPSIIPNIWHLVIAVPQDEESFRVFLI